MKSSWKRIAVIWLVTLVAACSSGAKKKATLPYDLLDVTFFDSDIFDNNLVDTLDKRPKRIQINSPSSIDLNDIPPRIEKWLVAVRDTGGKVNVAKEESNGLRTRGVLLDAIDVIFRFYDSISQNNMYKKSEGYDASLVYDSSGKIIRIELNKTSD